MIELVWDTRRVATVTAPSGASATVGDAADFSPEDLVATAAAACLMRTFLELAERAHIPILSFAATGCVERSAPHPDAHVTIRSFIVAPEQVAATEIRRLLDLARLASPICRMLGDRVACSGDIRCLHDACAS